MLRVARICSNVNDFNQERLRIEMKLLSCNYPPQIVSNEFLRFYQVNNAELLRKQLDEEVSQRLHRKLLYNPTRREKQFNYSLQHHVQHRIVLQEKPYDRKLMNVKYEYQSGPITKFSHNFFRWWHKHYAYPVSPVNNVTVRLLPKNHSPLESLHIHKPLRTILTRMEPMQN